ncbi:hypothetical protein P7D22_07225 [Lichenihabitans sp. Uapishka_5]|uniref:hypothetical protein n=1 Tax=Lichenihabitans sp. Uapishka_5 TaxID=3037302 RepID=UPI0029E8009A|nr:hypothetical protein [Lichenihabitans sp. Uapishka_5]MDX7950969.1 hypothetical protein [Lichenihabitans sp. Uapishka_5]
MSRLPPVPPASKPVHGPDGAPKTSVDISHRLRHQADKARRSAAMAASTTPVPPAKGSDLWLLAATGAVVAAIVWLSGKQRAGAAVAVPPKRRWQ